MRSRQPLSSSSSDDSDGSDLESCFDAENDVGEIGTVTNPTDVDSEVEEGENAATYHGLQNKTNITRKLLDQPRGGVRRV